MNNNQKWLIAAFACLIFSIGLSIMVGRITAGTVVAFALFIYGIYKAFIEK